MKSRIPEQKSQKILKVLQCGKCDYSCFNGSSMTYHRQAKHNNTRSACTQCDKEFKTNLDLVAHNRKFHKVGYFCFLCSFSTDALKIMKKHRSKAHSESKDPELVETNSLKSEKENLNMQDEKENLNITDIKDEKEMIESEALLPKNTCVRDRKEKIKEHNILQHKRKREAREELKEKVKCEEEPRKSEHSPEMFG